jgi:exosortase
MKVPRVPFKFDRLTRWHALAAGTMALLGIAVTFEAWRDIHFIASNDDEYSQIFLVPLVAAWLIWVRRMRLRHCPVRGTILGPVLAIAGAVIGSYGFNHGVQSFWHGGSLLVVLGCVVSVVGKTALIRFLPAVIVLVFLIPIPGDLRQRIAIPLQAYTAQIAKVVLDLARIETEVSGNTLIVNGVPVMIAEACNGMRLVMPLLLVAYAFAYGLPLRNGVRMAILLVSPLTALACNVARTLPTIWLYGRQDEVIARQFHDWSAWAMLPVAFLILMGVIRLFRWAALPVERYTLASQG